MLPGKPTEIGFTEPLRLITSERSVDRLVPVPTTLVTTEPVPTPRLLEPRSTPIIRSTPRRFPKSNALAELTQVVPCSGSETITTTNNRPSCRSKWFSLKSISFRILLSSTSNKLRTLSRKETVTREDTKGSVHVEPTLTTRVSTSLIRLRLSFSPRGGELLNTLIGRRCV